MITLSYLQCLMYGLILFLALCAWSHQRLVNQALRRDLQNCLSWIRKHAVPVEPCSTLPPDGQRPIDHVRSETLCLPES